MSSPEPDAARSVALGGADPEATLRYLSIMFRDPCTRLGPTRFERATQTPEGPAELRIDWADDVAEVLAWGPGSDWLLARSPGLLGATDDPGDFEPPPGILRDTWGRNQGLRLTRTSTLWHDLIWWIVQQRIRFADASQQWARMVHDIGEPAPGPGGLRTPPTWQRVAAMTYDSFHPYGIERGRADTMLRVAREMSRFEPHLDDEFARSQPRLASLRGVGPWTQAGVQSMTWGDPDAVIVGDLGIPSMVSWALAKEPHGDDARMIELLEPFKPNRYRVLQLLFLSGLKAPPRRSPTPYGTNPIRRR